MRKVSIGIDIGTSGCKVIAVDQAGLILGSAIKEYPLYQPYPDWSEQEPQDWWQGASTATKEVIDGLSSCEICGVSFSGQMQGMVALDRDGQVVRRAILWNDQRTGKQCEEITKVAGGLNGLLSYTNNMMLTGYTGGKILWMKQQEPENYERTVCILNPKDYIRYRMTGVIATEVSDASGTGLFDVKHNQWAYDLIDKIGLRRELFVECVESTDQAGAVTQQASALTGIPRGTPVYGGGGDAVISITGMGLAVPGKVGITLGTSGVVATCLPDYADNPKGCLQLFRSNNPGNWMAFGCTLSAAGSYQWFRNALYAQDSYLSLDQAAQKAPVGSDGLLFLPYLMGERCPLFDSGATGSFLGITSLTTKGHFARAVLEGVSYSLKQVYDMIVSASPTLKPNEIVLAGGGAKSPLWRQMLADIFSMPVHTVYGSAEGGAFGAAIIAGVGCGLWGTMEDAMKICVSESETLPIPEHTIIYAKQYEAYCKMYDALKWSYKNK